jgi:hypothetical protein
MAIRYSFFDAVEDSGGNYDRVYSSVDMASYFSSFIGNGVYASPSSNLQVVANNTSTLTISAGKAWINGYYFESTAAENVTVSGNSTALPRIDRIVLRLDLTKRLIEFAVKQGTPASSPVAPGLTRTATVHELGLATVRVGAGSTIVTPANTTDTRANNNVCGFVTGVVDQIDTTNLFQQYDAEFDDWFADIQGKLDDDVAGSLQNQIDALAAKVTVIYSGTDTPAASLGSNGDVYLRIVQ